jgi:predicted RNase H-like HicB family nuclease
MKDIDYYVTLPWTVRTGERDDDGHYFFLTIDELPGFIVAGESREELASEYWDALEVFLQSFLDDEEEVPLPAQSTVQAAVQRQARHKLSSPLVGRKHLATSTGFGHTPLRTSKSETRTGRPNSEFAWVP